MKLENLIDSINKNEETKRKTREYENHIEKFDLLRRERGFYTDEHSPYYDVNTIDSNYPIQYSSHSYRFNDPKDNWPRLPRKVIYLYDKDRHFCINSDVYVSLLDKEIEKEYNWLVENK